MYIKIQGTQEPKKEKCGGEVGLPLQNWQHNCSYRGRVVLAGHRDLWSRTESLDVTPCTDVQLVFDREMYRGPESIISHFKSSISVSPPDVSAKSSLLFFLQISNNKCPSQKSTRAGRCLSTPHQICRLQNNPRGWWPKQGKLGMCYFPSCWDIKSQNVTNFGSQIVSRSD